MIKRHELPGSEDVQLPSFEDSSYAAVGQFADQVNNGASSPLPPDHPLAIRYWRAGSRIYDVRSWKAAIEVGGTELAVA